MSNTYHRPTYTFKDDAYNATQVRLYGIHQTLKTNKNIGNIKIIPEKKDPKKADKKGGIISISGYEGNIGIFIADNVLGSIGIIYGYSYEGHCYDLPKPAIMLLPVEPMDMPEDDSGYYAKRNEGYKVWVVDKLSQCEQIEVTSGFVEELVLQANMPGKRSPASYRATMQMAHRSGRLHE